MPNPYVIQPLPFGARDIAAGDLLSFNVVLTGRALGQLPLIVYALQRALSDGLCKRRTQATLTAVEWEDGETRVHRYGMRNEAVYSNSSRVLKCQHSSTARRLPCTFTHRCAFNRQGQPLPVNKLSPRALMRTLLRRASLLFERHLDRLGVVTEPHELTARADQLQDERCLQWLDWTRYASRQGQEMILGGVVGTWRLRGDLGPLQPWLWLGPWLHLGKSAVMGMGGYRELSANELEDLGACLAAYIPHPG